MLASFSLAIGAPVFGCGFVGGETEDVKLCAAVEAVSLEKWRINRQIQRLSLSLIVLAISGAPAFAHHMMGGRTPATFGEGILSGLGHPIIGLDHLAAVVAVGCL